MELVKVIYFIIINIMSFYLVKQIMDRKKEYKVLSYAIMVKETETLMNMNKFNNALYYVSLIKFVTFAVFVGSMLVGLNDKNIL